MLRVTQQDSAEGAKSYYAKSDYLSEGQEIVGNWGGRGAAMLGLEGIADKKSFDLLCDNLHPQTGEKLTVRTREDRTVGYDFSFSVPKSVSLLYALTEDPKILEAFRAAVDETMRDIEAEMKTRVRKGKKDENRTTGNMVWAEFIHKTSRPVDGIPDPQLHAHCFAFNATWDDPEQHWKAGQFRELKRDAPFFQSVMRVRLANKLQDLGFELKRKRDDFEVVGVPALPRFSRRTLKIEQVYAEKLAKRLARLGHGEFEKGKLKVAGVEQSQKQITDAAKRFGIYDAKEKAELGEKTREKKNKKLSWEELRIEWANRLTDEERDSLQQVYRREKPGVWQTGAEKLAVDHAIAHCFVREAVVPVRKLMTEALKRGLGGVTVEDVARELASRPLIRGEHEGREMATTPAMKAAEKAIEDFAVSGRGKLRPFGDPTRPFIRDWLNDGQKAAVRHVMGSRDRVTLCRGPAGSGKTTMEEELGDALREANVPVVAVAQSTTAVEELQKKAAYILIPRPFPHLVAEMQQCPIAQLGHFRLPALGWTPHPTAFPPRLPLPS